VAGSIVDIEDKLGIVHPKNCVLYLEASALLLRRADAVGDSGLSRSTRSPAERRASSV
jgi:hypothetical protein